MGVMLQPNTKLHVMKCHLKFTISSFIYKHQLRHRNVKTEDVQVPAVDPQEEEAVRGKHHVCWGHYTRRIAKEGTFAIMRICVC